MADQFNLVISRLEMLKISNDSDFDSLPDDMLMQILIRIPAQDIHDSTMFVCRKWFEIIRTRSFIYTHLHHSTPVLLIMDYGVVRTTTFLSSTVQVNQFTISDFRCNSQNTYGWASCNGLMLDGNVDDNLALTITNPVTNQRFTLPPFPARVNKFQYPTYRSAIAYAATRMEYKVVRTYYIWAHKYYPTAPKHLTLAFCAILTVGVDDSWRRVDTKHLSLTSIHDLLRSLPLLTRGFVHWTKPQSRYVLTLNIETEVLTRIAVPTPCKGWCFYLMGESSLSLLIWRGLFKWEVWEMKPAETGEYCWTKLFDIDLEAHRALLNESCGKEEIPMYKPGDGDSLDCQLNPVGWLKYREIIVFVFFRPNKGGHHVLDELRAVYNIKTRDISFFKSVNRMCQPFLVHRNSLVRIPAA